jgi:poly(A) polymerase Pap1
LIVRGTSTNCTISNPISETLPVHGGLLETKLRHHVKSCKVVEQTGDQRNINKFFSVAKCIQSESVQKATNGLQKFLKEAKRTQTTTSNGLNTCTR